MLSKQSTISLIGKVFILKIPPEAWDAIVPHGPKVSQNFVGYLAAGVVRDIAQQVVNKTVTEKLMEIGRDLASFASTNLVQGWEDGDELCPPWRPFPVPWPRLEDLKGSDPNPWKVKSVEQLVLSDLLMSIAEVTTNTDISARLTETALILARSVSRDTVLDFEETQIIPRSQNAT